MGRDKALLPVADGTLLDKTVAALREVCGGGVVLASGSSDRYDWLGLPRVADRIPDGGPLAGLEAALTWMETQAPAARWLLALACDMPLVEAADLHELVDAFAGADREHGRSVEVDAVLAEGPRGPEPLFACYHVGVLPAVRAALERGERRMIAFHDDVRVRTHVPAAGRAGRNVNTPEDWQEWIATQGRELRA